MKKNKKYVAIILIALCIAGAGIAVWINAIKLDYVGEYNQYNLAKAERNGQYGYINEEKRAVIPIQYDEVEDFTDTKLAVVALDGKKGCFNVDGEEIFEPKYSEITIGEYNENGMVFVKADDEENFVDKQGKKIYQSCEETEAWDWLKVKLNDKFGCVDEDGNVILPCEYTDLELGSNHASCVKATLDGKLNFVSYDGTILYEEIGEFNENGWAKVKRNAQYGYIDEQGKVMIPTKYDTLELGAFQSNGYATVKGNNTINYVDKYGNMLYKLVRALGENGLAAAQDDSGYWGFIDENGKEVIPFYYTEVGDFQDNGLAKVKSGDSYGFINELGVIMIDPYYDEVSDFNENGMAMVRTGKRYNFVNSIGAKQYDNVWEFTEMGIAPAKKDGKYFFINKAGNKINDCIYDVVNSFDEGNQIYKVRQGTKYGLVNKNGEEMLPVAYDGIDTRYRYHIVWNGALYGVVTLEGKTLCDAEYKYIGDVDCENELLLAEKVKNQWELRNWNNETIIQFEADNAFFCNGFVCVYNGENQSIYNAEGQLVLQGYSLYGRVKDKLYIVKEEKWGVADSEVNIIVEPQYDRIRITEDGNYIFFQDDKAGIMDEKGNIVLEPKYTSINKDDDYYLVAEDGKYGYLDSLFNVVIPFQFDDASCFVDGIAVVKVGEKYGIINEKGQFILAPTYDDIGYVYEEDPYVKINNSGKYGLIDKNGNVVLWPEYDDIYVLDDWIEVEMEDTYGAMNLDLEWIVPLNYRDVGRDSEYNVMWADDMDDIRHYFDMNGNELIYGDGWKSSISEDGLITVSQGDGYSLYDAEGRYVRYLDYYNVCKFFRGLSNAEDEDYNCGFINEDGNIVIPFEFDNAGHFSEDGLVSVYKDGKWAFMDEAGELITDFIFDKVSDFSYGRAAVCRDGKWGYINAKGEEVIPVRYDCADDFYGSKVSVTIGTDEDAVEYTINYVGDIIEE